MSMSCDAGDYELPEFSSQKTVRAAKEHECCECREVISEGTKYERFSGKWEGCVRTFRTCERCADLRDSYAVAGHCFAFGSLWEERQAELVYRRLDSTRAHAVAEAVLERRYELYLAMRST